MKSKEILLWVVAIGALVLSLVTVIGPKGLKSDAARLTVSYQERQTRTCTYVNDRGGVSLGTVEYDPFAGKDMCTDVNGHTHQIKDHIQA